jgi:unsaturated rhamnogalacturonyl hydrolase
VANTPVGSGEWWWEDALFMVPPGFARLGAATGNKQYFATMNTLYWSSFNFLLNQQVGLLYRDHRGNDGSFWSRGNGWVIAGIARVLEYLPQDDPKRPDFVNAFKTMSTVLLKQQGADGLWRSNLMNANQFPNPETSGTGFFTFAFGWGVNNGILDRATYLPSAQKGWDGLVSHVDAAGKLGYVQAVGGAPGPATADSSLPYAIGAFLLAGGELAKLLPP